jgi:fused signal recognition particle receptor
MTKFDCTSCQDALADCLDAERQPTGDLAAHLAECTDCSAAWSQLQQAWSQLRPEGLALSAEAQARVLAYAAAHLPGAASRVEAAPSRPIGRWFWAAFALALALVIWKVGSVPEPMRAAPPEAGKVAQVDPAPAAERPPLPNAEASARAVSQEEGAAERPRPAAEVAAVDEKPAPRAEEGIASPAAPLRAAEQAPSSKAKAEASKEGDEAPRMAASAASRAPRLREEIAMEDALGGEAGAGADRVAGITAAPDTDEAAAPAVRAAAPAGRAAVRESRAAVSAPSAPAAVAGSQSAPPALDQATRAALDTLLQAGGSGAAGWSQLRSAASSSSLRGFEAVLASCGPDARLCDGAALGAGALRAAARRADATPLLQRAARSEVGAVAADARRLLAGQ